VTIDPQDFPSISSRFGFESGLTHAVTLAWDPTIVSFRGSKRLVLPVVSPSQVLHLAMNPEVEARKKMASDSLQAEVEELRAKVRADSRPITIKEVYSPFVMRRLCKCPARGVANVPCEADIISEMPSILS
jgi:hypothetical protein